MTWKCHRCGQVNVDRYYACMQCQTKKYICPKCGAVDYDYREGRRASLYERLKAWFWGDDR